MKDFNRKIYITINLKTISMPNNNTQLHFCVWKHLCDVKSIFIVYEYNFAIEINNLALKFLAQELNQALFSVL